VQLGDTVHLERTDDSEECHSDVFGITLLDDRHALDSASVVWPALGDLTEEVVIDPVDDLQVSRKQLLEQADFPFLECLGKDRVATGQF